jgi:hypothetical protein
MSKRKKKTRKERAHNTFRAKVAHYIRAGHPMRDAVAMARHVAEAVKKGV